MMKQMIFMVMAAAAILTAGGCRVIDNTPERPMPECRNISRDIKLGNAILAAFQHNDYQEFASHLPPNMAENMTKKDFETSYRNVTQEFGELKSYEFMTSLKAPVLKNLLWRVTFERKSESGKTVTNELMFRLVTGDLEEDIQLVSFGFI
ncbi:MAG: hypothetical protein PHI35_02165 [Victivallaceae bacterium]|nr:hypothetical protein [Victivallaceae bacterium]